MSDIDTNRMREVVQDGNYKNVWLNGSTHYEECIYNHYPCAVLGLCDEVDALQAKLAVAERHEAILEEALRNLRILFTNIYYSPGQSYTFTKEYIYDVIIKALTNTLSKVEADHDHESKE